MRRRGLIATIAVLVVLFVAVAFVLWPRTDPITQENFDRIRAGMSRAEVEAILGGPPGDYRSAWTDWPQNANDADDFNCGSVDWRARSVSVRGYEHNYFLHAETNSPGHLVTGLWFGNDGCVQVQFSPDAVDDKDFLPTVKRERGPLDNLLWRARRRWRKWFPS
jgi:hypothetical protein